MRMVALESLSLYLSIYLKNVQIGGRTHPVHECEDMEVPDSKLEINMCHT
jgi:hypothetical protein